MTGKWRLILAETETGEKVAVGPVHTEVSVVELQDMIERAGWTVTGVIPHLTRANFLARAYGGRRS